MFDVGFSELLIIAVVGLLVLGPQRLPHAARLAGLWVRRLRAHWYAVKADLERELANEEFQRSVGEPIEQLRARLEAEALELRRQIAQAAAPPDSLATTPATARPAVVAPAPTAPPDDAGPAA